MAAIFYGQAKPSEADVGALAKALELPERDLQQQLYGLPDRGRSVPMPPREPLIYRLYEIVQNYGYAYKAVLNEKFGDGIMSAISFSTNVKKETDDKVRSQTLRLKRPLCFPCKTCWFALTDYAMAGRLGGYYFERQMVRRRIAESQYRYITRAEHQCRLPFTRF